MAHTQPANAMVYLVGAGPGDAGLITARGLELLRRAEVVVFDALANPALLDEVPASAEMIDAGKRAKAHRLTQDQTNQLLVDKAKEGKQVVRLKGGDPYLFGRGAEEAAFLAEHGVRCEIVPGVTSGIAAPGAAGIPVTHRKIASTVTFVTGHEDPSKDDTSVDYAALARLIGVGGTVCFYMGVGRLASICDELIAGGLANTTPIALVQWGTRSKQRSVRSTLQKVEDDVAAAGIGSPAIIVVGPVAAISEPGLDWFEKRPLFGQRVLITRTRQQASALRLQLFEQGADVLEAPTIAIEPAPAQEQEKVDAALADLSKYDWLVLTSVNGVVAVADRLAAMQADARKLAGVKIAAIGESTERALRQMLGIRADLVPTRYVAESLAAELIADHDAANKRFLLLRADIARPILHEKLLEAGADVTECVAYQTVAVDALPENVTDALAGGEVDWITFTSASTARNLAELLGGADKLPAGVKLASIGQITSAAIRELGWEPTIEAQNSNIEGLVDALCAACAAK